MSFNVNIESGNHKEQIYDSNQGLYVLNKIQHILEQDKFNLFKLKSSIHIDQQIDQTNRDIEKLISLRDQGNEQIEILTEELNKLKKVNSQRRQMIGGVLDAI